MAAQIKPDDAVDTATMAVHGHLRRGSAADVQATANEPSFVSNAVGMMGGPAGVAFMAPMAIPAVASVAGGVGYIGKEFGVGFIEKAGGDTQKAINNLTDKEVSQLLGGNRVSAAVGRGAKRVAGVVGDGLNKFTSSTGIDQIAPKYSGWRLKSHSARLDGLLANTEQMMKDLPHHGYQEAKKILKHARMPAGQINPETIGSLGREYANELSKADKLSAREKMAIRSLNNIAKTADKVAASHSGVASAKNMGGVVKELPQAIAKSKIIPGVMNTAFIGMSAMGMFGAAKGFAENMASLKEMASDITGKKVSTFAVLTGDVPPVLAEDRSKLLKNFAVSEVTGAASLGMMVLSAVKNRVGLLGFIVPDLAGKGVNMLIGESAVPYYAAIKQAHAKGQEIPVEAYAELLGNVSKELKVRGGVASPFTQEIAKQYAAVKAPPAQIMREATNGGVGKRINAIIAANEAVKPSHSHVAALNNKPKEYTQPVVGNYTQKLVENASKASQVLNPSVV